MPQKVAPSSFAPPSHAPPSNAGIPPTSGEILIFDADKLEVVNVVDAHRSPLSCAIFNNEGTMLATSSDKGTIIRVFSVPDATKLYQFRRGSMPSRIYSMAFNATSTLLCVSSATETVHVFKLGQQGAASPPQTPSSPTKSFNQIRDRRYSQGSDSSPIPDPSDSAISSDSPGPKVTDRKHNGTFMGMIRRTSQNVGNTFATTVGSYLPKGVTEMWEPTRDFAWIKLPKAGGAGATGSGPLKSVVAMSSNSPQVMVVTNEGNFYVYNIDLAKGGEGTLTKQFS
jgi:autophagy-related protein 18